MVGHSCSREKYLDELKSIKLKNCSVQSNRVTITSSPIYQEVCRTRGGPASIFSTWDDDSNDNCDSNNVGEKNDSSEKQ